jgi:plasmid stability protein
MVMLQIRNVSEETRRELKRRAAARGESLNSFLLDVLAREVALPTVAEVLERAARRAEHLATSVVPVLDDARDERDAESAERATR